MAKVNGSDIAGELAAAMGLSRSAAKSYMDFIFESVKRHAEDGDKVSIQMFGTFSMQVTAPRKGRDIHANRPVDIPAKHKLAFEMSRQLRQQYNPGGDKIVDLE